MPASSAPGDQNGRTAAEHEAIWQRFLQEPSAQLSSGRLSAPPEASVSLVFQVSISDGALRRALQTLGAELATTGAFAPFPPGYWHATIVPPAFLADEPSRGSLLLPRSFAQEAMTAAREVLSGYPPFDMHVRGVNAFQDVVVAVLYESGHFADIQRLLRERLPQLPERYLDGYEPLPHISLGVYQDLARLPQLTDALAANREREIGRMTARGIEMLIIPLQDGRMGEPERHPVPF